MCLSEQKGILKSGAESSSRKPKRLHGKHEGLAPRELTEKLSLRNLQQGDPWRTQAIGSGYVFQRHVPRREGTLYTTVRMWAELESKQDSFLQESLRTDTEVAQSALNRSMFTSHQAGILNKLVVHPGPPEAMTPHKRTFLALQLPALPVPLVCIFPTEVPLVCEVPGPP